MPEVTAYAPGTPSWVELSTNDAAGTVAFYGKLFGWTEERVEMTPGCYYHVMQLNGLPVAAIYPLSDAERALNLGPRWNTYFTVADADATTALAQQHGGAALVGPLEVPGAGRMAFLRDPQGAYFSLWQPGGRIGARLTNEPNAMCWHELATTDREAAIDFYTAALPLERGASSLLPMEEGADAENFTYNLLRAGGADVGGVLRIPDEMRDQVPPNWLVHFAAADVDAMTAQVAELGGVVHLPVSEINDTRFAIVGDPQGAILCIVQHPWAPANLNRN